MRPKISIVAASRNDDHGGDMLRRTSAFVSCLDWQACRSDVNIEMLLVDWNPPIDRPRLSEVLPRPSANSPMVIRHIVVPEAIHRRWQHSEHIPLFQMIAKNVGIRRAEADFVLCTNVDLLFSDGLIKFLAEAKFDPSVMYRANRCDVPRDVLDQPSVEEQLRYCENNILMRLGLVPWGFGKKASLAERAKHRLGDFFRRMLGKEVRPPLDADACGDFTMMAKTAWEKIKGYVELGLYSIYIDELGCIAARASGLNQITLPPECCAYHINHDSGWMSMDIVAKMRFTSERPSLDRALVHQASVWMNSHGKPITINSEEWGCAQDYIPEVVFGKFRNEA